MSTLPADIARRGLTCWLLDTRSLWPGNKITDSTSAREALALISPEEQENITRKYHIADARMSLGSALLKRLFIHSVLEIPWNDITIRRKRDPTHGKPYALLPSGAPAPLEFNVSHQAGLVALVGCSTTPDAAAELGVDIVCVNERNDLRSITTEGFDTWVDMYSDIFSAQESFDMKYTAPSFSLPDRTLITPELLGRHDRCCTRGELLSITLPNGEETVLNSDSLIDAKLRRFYTYWCYKEAFIKLDGEALLASWLQRLEFRNVRAPATPAKSTGSGTGSVWGERVSDAEIWFSREPGGQEPRGVQNSGDGCKRMVDTRVQIVGFEEKFMIAVAARGMEKEVLTDFKLLDLEKEVLGVAKRVER